MKADIEYIRHSGDSENLGFFMNADLPDSDDEDVLTFAALDIIKAASLKDPRPVSIVSIDILE